MNDAVLILEGITKTYKKGQGGEINVLRGADLSLKSGEIVALVAPSGAGKSTLLHMAGLLDTPDAGHVVLAGQNMHKKADRHRTTARRQQIGFVYQFHHLLPEFTALENVVLPQLADGKTRAHARSCALDLLDQVGLKDRASHRPAELSGGEQQRVAFCRALANSPRILLADEPTGNLDPETSAQVFQMLTDLVRKTGLTALIATHNRALSEQMDRVVYLVNGRLSDHA